MEQNQQILRDQFGKLPQVLRNFISRGNWSDTVINIAKRFGLANEKYASFENEILFVLTGLQLKNDFTENIKRELEIDANVAGWIAEDVEKNIFGKVANEIDSMWQAEESPTGEESGNESSGVGGNFEQIILNQARAMQPAVAISSQQLVAGSKVQESLSVEQEKPRIVHNYTGSDPYREPIE